MRTVLALVFGAIAVVAAAAWLFLQFGTERLPTAPVEEIADGEVSAPVVDTAPAPVAAPAPDAPVPEAPAPGSVNEEIQSRSIQSDDRLAPEEMRAAESAASEQAERVFEAASAPAADAPAPSAAQAEPAIAQDPAATAAAAAPGLADQFKARQVTYNRPPAKMLVDRTIDVSLVINATEDSSAGADALQGFPGTVVEREVALSESVSAQLTGVGFDIESQTVSRQKLSERTLNRWQWRVTPREPGTHTLILAIFGYTSGSDEAEPLDAYRDQIQVEVQQVEQLVKMANSYQPLFAAIAGLAGLVSAFFAFMRFREERKRGTGS